MPTISRVIIFGDSVSDIGNMKARSLSKLPMVQLNKWGRFSDGRNWVDYFWESLGGKMFDPNDVKATLAESKRHMSLTTAGSGGQRKMELVNYAEGGAVGWHKSDGESWGGYFTSSLLSTLKEQVKKYKAERDKKWDSVFLDKETLFIIWIGANDVVTVNREPEAMPGVAEYIFSQACALLDEAKGSHVVIIGLPDPQYMPRFSPKDSASLRKKISAGARNFNNRLSELVDTDVKFNYLPTRSTIEFFDIGQVLGPKFLAEEGFAPFAQPKKFKKGDKVGKLIETAPLLQYTDTALDEDFDFGSVSDLLHPTEGVYSTISDVVTAYLSKECHFSFGR
ncbi:hypothetical protein CYFUS_002248 [Cystobacter fuscus]|uniref:SGNH hydrolase-type esterase domain-containing protein n=1 Tax=Cystobacter fuscus TaxID=43 RepID=A0A250IZV5_9BACT|nr:SGNH/GDSL hydrolase family protein [Cystobacter fuscus]ATB36833.1 hypothetical protein CYFUS_002248 [Cystobacter fuscus]